MAGKEHGDTFAEMVAEEAARAAVRQRRFTDGRAAIGVKQTMDELRRLDPVESLDIYDEDLLDLAQRAVRFGLATGRVDTIEDAYAVINAYRGQHSLG